jgi:phage terminase large subunit
LIYKRGLTNIVNLNVPNQLSVEGELTKLGLKNDHRKIWGDCAEPKTIQDLRNCGFNVYASDKGKDSMVNGIVTMQKYRLNIIGANLKKEVKSYRWKENKDGDLINK